MTNLSQRRNSKLVIGPYSFIQNLKISKENSLTHWIGPYEIKQVFDNSFVRIKTIDE